MSGRPFRLPATKGGADSPWRSGLRWTMITRHECVAHTWSIQRRQDFPPSPLATVLRGTAPSEHANRVQRASERMVLLADSGCCQGGTSCCCTTIFGRYGSGPARTALPQARWFNRKTCYSRDGLRLGCASLPKARRLDGHGLERHVHPVDEAFRLIEEFDLPLKLLTQR